MYSPPDTPTHSAVKAKTTQQWQYLKYTLYTSQYLEYLQDYHHHNICIFCMISVISDMMRASNILTNHKTIERKDTGDNER